MKQILLVCLALLFALPSGYAQAADGLDYTISTKNGTVLQGVPDRSIAVRTDTARHPAIPGESPVTGLPWEGQYLPILVQIGNTADTVKVSDVSLKASGIGRRSPWGLQYADILYEETVYGSAYTRFTALFSDCFSLGEPAGGVGPVRSCRLGPMLLREEWQAGLVYNGGFGPRDQRMDQFLSETDAQQLGLLMNTRSDAYARMGSVVRDKGKKVPDVFSADIVSMRNTVLETTSAAPRPFLFQDGGAYTETYASATAIHLDWGYQYNISHFMYDEAEGVYYRYCGAGTNPVKWALFTAFPAAEDNEEAHKLPLAFANVIVQRVEITFDGEIDWKPVVQSVGRGNADIFIGGRYIQGYWVRNAIGEPTVFYDDTGAELRLDRGKTYIAHFPIEARCTFAGAE